MFQKIKNIYHLVSAVLANIYYGFPSRNFTVIGVTGTDGKTTTVNLIYHILKTAGKRVSKICSIEAVINGEIYDTGFHVTTPNSWRLLKFFKKAVDKRAKNFIVLEVTSHAIDQHRVWGINFDAAVLTNVTREHLDYHKTYENYALTKLKLLKIAKTALTNKDDSSFEIISKDKTLGKLYTYSISQDADFTLKDFPLNNNFFGEFNNYNVIAAASVCKILGISRENISKAIESFKLPRGRQEIVHDDNFTVMVDFAHTPNAFEKLLKEAKRETKGRVIHVFGSAGKRDSTKRPLMGEISDRFSDVIILTSEDPRGERIDRIMDDIEKGVKDSKKRTRDKTLLRVSDRQEAITTAIKMARKNDLVILTGKSHEKSMNFGKGEEAWDEYEAIEKALRLRSGQSNYE